MDFLKLAIAFSTLLLVTTTSQADTIKLKRGKTTIELEGEILLEAQDGSLLFQANDGELWIAKPNELKEKVESEKEVAPMTAKEMGEQLLAELPEGFRVRYEPKPFVIAYQTENDYAAWIGGLYKKLAHGFEKRFEHDLDLNAKSKFPLAVIIFSTREEYAKYVKAELGQEPGTMVAYYNVMTNRVAMYDLTNDKKAKTSKGSNRKKRGRRIADVLNTPGAVPMVATVIHEGTHQLMHNRGMQTRFSGTPLWLNEGMAMFFETPDLTQRSGYRKIGQINGSRLRDLLPSLDNRDPKQLELMITTDKFLQAPETATVAYAEAWGFNYFLLKKHKDEYFAYLKFLSKKKPMDFADSKQRLAEFKKFLGDDLKALDTEFVKYMRSLDR